MKKGVKNMENLEWKKFYASIIVAVFFAITCFAALNFIDGMAGGYAIAFLSFFVTLSGIAVALLFFHRARVMDTILNSNQLVAHWVYSQEMAQDSAQREYRTYLERNHVMFILIGGMLVVAALFLIIFVQDGGLITGVFLLAFTLVLFIISRFAPRLELNRALKTPREAFIAKNGIIYEGAVYPFHSFMMKMDEVTLQKATKTKNPELIFSFTQLVGLYIIQPFDIVVPIPADQVDTAQGIIRALNGDIPEDEK
jgi:hypothetical protein